MLTDRAVGLAPDRARPVAVVREAMLTELKLSRPDAAVRELRVLFGNAHVHAGLIVGDGTLLAVVERADLLDADDSAPALPLGRLHARTVAPDADLDLVRQQLLTSGRRRLAVVAPDGSLLGLLCLKRSRTGFCSNRDILARRM